MMSTVRTISVAVVLVRSRRRSDRSDPLNYLDQHHNWRVLVLLQDHAYNGVGSQKGVKHLGVFLQADDAALLVRCWYYVQQTIVLFVPNLCVVL